MFDLLDTRVVSHLVRDAIGETIDASAHRPVDVALIGSATGHYGWQRTRLADIDVWILGQQRTSAHGRDWATALCSRVEEKVLSSNSDCYFEARAIDGPYKPAHHEDGRPSVFLHLLIDDVRSFEMRSRFARFSWRKYPAWILPGRLKSLAPPLPDIEDLISDRWGLSHVIAGCTSGTISMEELDLIGGDISTRQFFAGSSAFREFCTYGPMMAGRNRARTDRHEEPDSFPNLQFAQWYNQTYGDPYLEWIAEIKGAERLGRPSAIDSDELRFGVTDWCERLRTEIKERKIK